MLKVLHMIETGGPGGAENVLIRLLEALHGRGYTVAVCLLKPGWLNDQLTARGFDTRIIPLKRSLDPRWLGRVARYIREQGYDVIHSHEFAMNVHAGVLSRMTGIPVVATVHGRKYYADRLVRRVAYRMVARTAAMVAVSGDIRTWLADRLSIPKRRVHVIPNGIRTDLYRSAPAVRETTRRELAIAENQFMLLAVGNLYDVKGHTHLIDAARTVCDRYPDARFMVAGRGYLHDELNEKIRRLGLESNFELLGFREDVDRLLQAADAFVMSSLSEGLPLSMLEAMAAGKVVISTAVGGIPYVIHDEQTGFLAPPGDGQALAERILAAMSSRATRDEIIAAAGNLVEGEFSLRAMVDGYTDLYAQVVKKRVSGGETK